MKSPAQKQHQNGKGGSNGKTPNPAFKNRPFLMNVGLTVLLLIILSFGYNFFDTQEAPENIPLSQVANDVTAGKVQTIVVRGDKLELTYADAVVKKSEKETGSSLVETLASYGVSQKQLATTTLSIKQESGFWYWVFNLAPIFLPLGFIIFFIWMLTRQVKGAGMQAFSFGQSRAKFFDPKDKLKITFKDVAGVKEAKEELLEIVDFLKNPKKFLKIGARIPKGVLLMGAPGTGKTLLARAVAGEANVPFFSISGSEFVEMFVGVGASRVRDLFQTVKRSGPAIIFIDEIDAVGRIRGAGLGGGNDEREQTLNQILVEMDGFEPNAEIIVMAATNRPDVLDPALLRPGRFDRRVRLDLPDRADREAILGIHARSKPLAEDANLKVIAERTPGFSGADLQSLMNEAAILAARENRMSVSQFDLIRSIEKVMLGPERKSHILTDKEKKITAYHEAGHALVASVLPNSDPIHKISIIARGHAGGYTLSLPLEERRLLSRKEFIDRLAMTLGGYAAEMLIFGDVTTGPSNDLQVASALARDMVMRYGMSEKLGPIAFEDDDMKMATNGVMQEGAGYSEKVAALIDEEVSAFIKSALVEAENALKNHRAPLDAIVVHLLEKETIEQDEFEAILRTHGIAVKKDTHTEKVVS
jgi:cell division protease FtsH